MGNRLRLVTSALLVFGVASAMTACGSDSNGNSANPLSRIEQVVPEAGQTVSGGGPGNRSSVYSFLESIVKDVDAYWDQTFKQSGLPTPDVTYEFMKPGTVIQTSCVNPDGSPGITDDTTMMYCAADDTIYFAQRVASVLWDQASFGDFGIAYILAHEYGHNVERELGVYSLQLPTINFELQADCLAGNWANSVYQRGLLDNTDVPEAIGAAWALGDRAFTASDHHGTPPQRSEAWRLGYDSGNPSACADKYDTPLQPGAEEEAPPPLWP